MVAKQHNDHSFLVRILFIQNTEFSLCWYAFPLFNILHGL